jgi:hypothetical protein
MKQASTAPLPAPVAAPEPAADAPNRLALNTVAWSVLLTISLLSAAYTGFRMPNLWSATLYTPSLVDGFHRRFLVGTLLRPWSDLLNYNYWLYAAVAFAILGVLLLVLVVNVFRSRLVSQRVLVIAFLLLPTGGYLFHEVGYLDQLLYLALFAALSFLRGRAWVAAPILLVLTVCTHEIAILTIVPIYGFVVLKDIEWRRAAAVLVPPIVAAFIILLVSPVESGAVARLQDELKASNFVPRPDALDLFGRSLSDNWKLYSRHQVFDYLWPLALVMIVGFAFLYWIGSRRREGGPSILYLVLAAGAIGAPVVLALAGWDEDRWAFLLVCNFFIVVWIWLRDTGRELDAIQAVALAVVLLFVMHADLRYFDGYSPRRLHPVEIRRLDHQIEDGSLFEIPKR